MDAVLFNAIWRQHQNGYLVYLKPVWILLLLLLLRAFAFLLTRPLQDAGPCPLRTDGELGAFDWPCSGTGIHSGLFRNRWAEYCFNPILFFRTWTWGGGGVGGGTLDSIYAFAMKLGSLATRVTLYRVSVAQHEVCLVSVEFCMKAMCF